MSPRLLLAHAMTPNPVTIAPKSVLFHALSSMVISSCGMFQLTEEVGSGIVSRGDFQGMEFEEFNWDGISKATGIATNREAVSIIKNQQPLVLAADETVQRACQSMSEMRCGSVLVVDKQKRLTGVFTGRDAVRLLADGKDAAEKVWGSR